jgi:hypothetical protein
VGRIFPFRSKDPHFAIVIEYCNHVETLYPSVARNTWSNEEGEASIWEILHMLIEPLPFAEIEQFIAGEYHKFGLKMKNGNTHTTNEESW